MSKDTNSLIIENNHGGGFCNANRNLSLVSSLAFFQRLRVDFNRIE